ncbi:MAG: TetR/AcrR family transcriptional regulator [bacterium]|nr:TetR/AcrR family transcriptional regulator [bacterium]
MAHSTPAVGFAHPPKQHRSQQTLERILIAGEVLLREKRFDDVTVAEIVAQARSSSGSFYARFPDKRALLHALHERFGDRVRRETDAVLAPERWHGAPTGELLEEVVAYLVKLFQDHEGVLRAVLSEAVLEQTFAERAISIALGVRAKLWVLLEPRRPGNQSSEFQASFDIGFRMALATLDQRLFFGRLLQHPAIAREERELSRHLTLALARILGVAEQPGESSRPQERP